MANVGEGVIDIITFPFELWQERLSKSVNIVGCRKPYPEGYLNCTMLENEAKLMLCTKKKVKLDMTYEQVVYLKFIGLKVTRTGNIFENKGYEIKQVEINIKNPGFSSKIWIP